MIRDLIMAAREKVMADRARVMDKKPAKKPDCDFCARARAVAQQMLGIPPANRK